MKENPVARLVSQVGSVRKVVAALGERDGKPIVSVTHVQRWRRSGEVFRLRHALRFARLLEPGDGPEARLRRLDLLESMVPAPRDEPSSST